MHGLSAAAAVRIVTLAHGKGFAAPLRLTALAFVAALLPVGIGQADELHPVQGGSLHLGADDGSIYYTVEPDGYRLVVTVTATPAEAPIRFVATLQSVQSVVLSVARAPGEPPNEVLIRRIGDRLVYDPGARYVAPTD